MFFVTFIFEFLHLNEMHTSVYSYLYMEKMKRIVFMHNVNVYDQDWMNHMRHVVQHCCNGIQYWLLHIQHGTNIKSNVVIHGMISSNSHQGQCQDSCFVFMRSRNTAKVWVLHKLQVFLFTLEGSQSFRERLLYQRYKGQKVNRRAQGQKVNRRAQVTAVQGGNCWYCVGCVLVVYLGVGMDINRQGPN